MKPKYRIKEIIYPSSANLYVIQQRVGFFFWIDTLEWFLSKEKCVEQLKDIKKGNKYVYHYV